MSKTEIISQGELTPRVPTAAEFQGLATVPPEWVGKEQREERIPTMLHGVAPKTHTARPGWKVTGLHADRRRPRAIFVQGTKG